MCIMHKIEEIFLDKPTKKRNDAKKQLKTY